MDDEDGASDAIYLLRTMQQHHVALSSMADQKANILIGATLVVFALIVREGALNSGLSVPLLILAVSAFVAAALCVIAVIPSLGTPKRATTPNMLFFGTFADLDEAGFRKAMAPILHDNVALHAAMLRDIHQLGCVLKHKKYKYLAWGYRVFIAGLAVTLVAFGATQLI